MNTIWALAGVVIKELYRRKDFYVLFVLTAVITIAAGAVRFFDDPKIVTYLKAICVLLISVSALLIAIITGLAVVYVPAHQTAFNQFLAHLVFVAVHGEAAGAMPFGIVPIRRR